MKARLLIYYNAMCVALGDKPTFEGFKQWVAVLKEGAVMIG